MKEFYRISIFEADNLYPAGDGKTLPPALFAECRHRWPQYFAAFHTSMEVFGQKDDPTVAEVIAFLREHGREPYLKQYPTLDFRHPTMYRVDGERQFEAEDLGRGEYFRFFPKERIAAAHNGVGPDTDLYEVEGNTISKRPIGNTSFSPVAICSDELRGEMEDQRFLGLCFREVLIKGKAKKSPLWQLWSDREMPTIKNRIVDCDGNDVMPGSRNGRYIDDFFFPPLVRFSALEVCALQPFDAALTRERFGHAVGPFFPPDSNYENMLDPMLIVSRRFYEWSIGRKLKLSWYPCALE